MSVIRNSGRTLSDWEGSYNEAIRKVHNNLYSDEFPDAVKDDTTASPWRPYRAGIVRDIFDRSDDVVIRPGGREFALSFVRTKFMAPAPDVAE